MRINPNRPRRRTKRYETHQDINDSVDLILGITLPILGAGFILFGIVSFAISR